MNKKEDMRIIVLLQCILLLTMSTVYAQNRSFKNKNLSPEERAIDLLSKMTLEEKIMQMQCLWRGKSDFFDTGKFNAQSAAKFLPNGIGSLARTNEDMHPDAIGPHATLSPREGAIQSNQVQKFFIEETRLGIPVLIHEEGLHGQQAQDATSFPVPIGLASSWNEDLVHEVYSIVAKEIRYRGGHQVLAPVVDVVRDPRWGRTEECMGEDPFLVSRLGVAQVKAYQGKGVYLDEDHVGATLKHFGVHGQPEGGHNTAPSFIDERTTLEVFLKPFQDCIDAGVMNIMVTYNELWGIPAHANEKLLKNILRDKMGYEGIVVSDYYAIENFVKVDLVTPSESEAGYLGFKSGVDIELPDYFGFQNLETYVKEGKISEAEIDEVVTRILIEKFRLGLFDNPYVDPDRAENFVGCQKNRDVAYKAAAESMVLLKNDNKFLPLDKNEIKTIAFIGPNADRCILGGYASEPKQRISPLQALKEKYSDKMDVLYAEGVRLTDVNSPFPEVIRLVPREDNDARITEAVEIAKKADVIVLFVGSNEAVAREAYGPTAPGDMPTLDLLNGQNELIEKIVALGKPTCAFVNSGQPLSIGNLVEQVPAVMQAWFLGQETGYAIVDALFGELNPSGKLPITFPRSAGHIPAHYSYKPSARRGYNLGLDASPLFPFGYGLSYTSFEYSNLRISSNEMQKDGTIEVSVDIKNIGDREGAEVVQMYIRDDYSSVTRPVKELKGFEKVWLKQGESQTVKFSITLELLAFYDVDMNWIVEPGDFTIMVGSSSRDVKSIKLSVTE
ncbi:glycoside hydrolase family 3 N-terminal domain-containing protein [uncultured Draconibacterium sp.]|uniref:glycoside hydrolase family 3 N-terminal domain-containing protein n=1 Tax=uncultured Draconibacterium sp. TaxID=1573823 RepID=UPI002AA64FF9|nr:glycoside hydrolase family 3 N-terminal domain-containing protein [uncultured Draconibacterium sp.]